MRSVTASPVSHDHKLLEATIEAMVIERPEPTEQAPQNLCLDKGYDNKSNREVVKMQSYKDHIRRTGEEKLDQKGKKKHPVRRYVVERTLAWLSKCRGLLVRYEGRAKTTWHSFSSLALCSGTAACPIRRPHFRSNKMLLLLFVSHLATLTTLPVLVTLVKAGRLLDPRTGNVLSPAAVLIENGKIKEVGHALRAHASIHSLQGISPPPVAPSQVGSYRVSRANTALRQRHFQRKGGAQRLGAPPH